MAANPDPLSADLPSLRGGVLDSPSGIADALGKLLVFAAVYPPEHVRVTTLAVPLADAIASRATDDVPCVIELVEEGMLVDGQVVPLAPVATRHLRRDLEQLRVCEVDFFRTVTASDVTEFANAARTALRRENSRRTFAEPGTIALPPSIAARFSDFGTPVFGSDDEGATWCGEILDLGEPETSNPDTPLEDWRRLSRMLVTGMLNGTLNDSDFGFVDSPADDESEAANDGEIATSEPRAPASGGRPGTGATSGESARDATGSGKGSSGGPGTGNTGRASGDGAESAAGGGGADAGSGGAADARSERGASGSAGMEGAQRVGGARSGGAKSGSAGARDADVSDDDDASASG